MGIMPRLTPETTDLFTRMCIEYHIFVDKSVDILIVLVEFACVSPKIHTALVDIGERQFSSVLSVQSCL